MSALDLKKFQKADDADLPGVRAFRDKKEILGNVDAAFSGDLATEELDQLSQEIK